MSIQSAPKNNAARVLEGHNTLSKVRENSLAQLGDRNARPQEDDALEDLPLLIGFPNRSRRMPSFKTAPSPQRPEAPRDHSWSFGPMSFDSSSTSLTLL